MGGKKRRVIYYTGSLISSAFRYLLKAEFNLVKHDRRGTAICDELFKELYSTPKKYLQPNLEIKYGEDPKLSPESNFYFKFLNGMEHKINLGKTDIPSVKNVLNFYNDHIELERAEKGHDDEPEDEDDYLKTK